MSGLLPLERSTVAALEAIRAFVERREPDTTVVISVADLAELRLRPSCVPARPECARALERAGGADGPPCVTTRIDRMVCVADVEADERWRESASLCRGLGVQAFMSTPLLAADEDLLGTLCICYRWPAELSAARRELLATAAERAAAVLERARHRDGAAATHPAERASDE